MWSMNNFPFRSTSDHTHLLVGPMFLNLRLCLLTMFIMLAFPFRSTSDHTHLLAHVSQRAC